MRKLSALVVLALVVGAVMATGCITGTETERGTATGIQGPLKTGATARV